MWNSFLVHFEKPVSHMIVLRSHLISNCSNMTRLSKSKVYECPRHPRFLQILRFCVPGVPEVQADCHHLLTT